MVLGEAPSESVAEQRDRILAPGRAQRLLPGCPLMHGTGQFTALNALGGGGAVVTVEGRRLDAEALWSTVEARSVAAIAIVGDAFAKRMLAALAAHPGRWDLSCCRLIVSSGVLWSPPVKQALLRHLPHAVLMDSFGSSEAVGFGVELTTRGSRVELGRFRIAPGERRRNPRAPRPRLGVHQHSRGEGPSGPPSLRQGGLQAREGARAGGTRPGGLSEVSCPQGDESHHRPGRIG